MSCQMNFCKIMNFQLTPLSKNFPKPCMFLLLLCLSTILAPSCPASCQPSCSPPPQLGLSGRPGSTPSAALQWPLHGPALLRVSCLKACTAVDTTPGSLHRRGRPPGSRPGGLAATKRVSFSDPLFSSPSSSPAPPHDSPGNVFLPSKEVFACPGPAAPSQPPQTWYPSLNRHRPRGWTSHLFSSQPRPELGGSPVESWLHPW